MRLLKFYTKNCAPCKLLQPTLEQALKGKDIELVTIDAEKYVVLSTEYKIRGVPTLILLDDDGNEIKRLLGARKLSEIELFLEGN